MELLADRRWPKATYTIGNLYVDSVLECNTLEDTDRGLTSDMPLASIRSIKVYGETAIPKGRYRVRMDVVSPKYLGVKWYKDLTGGYMPRLENVPGFESILIHPGSTALDSLGCLLVGRNTVKGKVTSSRDTFEKLYKKMKKAHDRGEEIWITIR